MIRVQVNTFIRRPVEVVFAYTADPANFPSWVNEVLKSEPTGEGALGVGSTFKQELALGASRQIETEYEVIEMVERESFVFKSIAGIFPITSRYRFASTGEGTVITFVEESDPPGLYYKIVRPLVGLAIKRRLKYDFRSLKEILEPEDGGTEPERTSD